MAFQTRDVLDAMAAAGGQPLTALRVDGGATANGLLLQLVADQLQLPVTRPVIAETTALGAAYAAGLGAGVWSSPAELAATWRADVTVEPAVDRSAADAAYAVWLRAVERSRGWVSERSPAPAGCRARED
jgi:glycerol kinase